ncbi:hypothetical protein [Streptomyces anulatus]|uniref:hypothetical protein n=1 Tax=Streptomyces anulatus TaxID=1892 RepID=UPI00365B4C1E
MCHARTISVQLTPADGRGVEEHLAFWSWTIVAVLRHTGIRVEELTGYHMPSPAG